MARAPGPVSTATDGWSSRLQAGRFHSRRARFTLSSREQPSASASRKQHASAPRKQHALELFAGLPSRYERMGALLSFGQDPRWRAALVDAIDPRPGQRVLDVATGTGLVARELAHRCRCEVVGLDQSEEMLRAARDRLAADPELAGRISLVHGEAEHLPFDDAEFDAL